LVPVTSFRQAARREVDLGANTRVERGAVAIMMAFKSQSV
jgi:hypothetical protein